jgi:hypothetical protein
MGDVKKSLGLLQCDNGDGGDATNKASPGDEEYAPFKKTRGVCMAAVILSLIILLLTVSSLAWGRMLMVRNLGQEKKNGVTDDGENWVEMESFVAGGNKQRTRSLHFHDKDEAKSKPKTRSLYSHDKDKELKQRRDLTF